MNEKITTTLPLTDDELDLYFDDIESYVFSIDFDKSDYAGVNLITYIYNSGMNADLVNYSYNDRFVDTMMAYIETDNLVSVDVLNNIWLDVLYYFIVSEYNFVDDKPREEFIRSFIETHKSLIQKLVNVLFSMKIFLFKSTLEIELDAKSDTFKTIGRNFIALRQGAIFYYILSLVDRCCEEYIEYREFKDNGYDGHKIGLYFLNDLNPISLLETLKEITKEEETAS